MARAVPTPRACGITATLAGHGSEATKLELFSVRQFFASARRSLVCGRQNNSTNTGDRGHFLAGSRFELVRLCWPAPGAPCSAMERSVDRRFNPPLPTILEAQRRGCVACSLQRSALNVPASSSEDWADTGHGRRGFAWPCSKAASTTACCGSACLPKQAGPTALPGWGLARELLTGLWES